MAQLQLAQLQSYNQATNLLNLLASQPTLGKYIILLIMMIMCTDIHSVQVLVFVSKDCLSRILYLTLLWILWEWVLLPSIHSEYVFPFYSMSSIQYPYHQLDTNALLRQNANLNGLAHHMNNSVSNSQLPASKGYPNISTSECEGVYTSSIKTNGLFSLGG